MRQPNRLTSKNLLCIAQLCLRPVLPIPWSKEKFRPLTDFWPPSSSRLPLAIGQLSPTWHPRSSVHYTGAPFTTRPEQMHSCFTFFSQLLHRDFFHDSTLSLAEVVIIVLLKMFNTKFWAFIDYKVLQQRWILLHMTTVSFILILCLSQC